MRKIILLLVFVLIFYANGFCHDPSSINVTVKKGAIEVAVSHSVSNPATHYVKKIEVKVNGEKTAEKDFTSQTDDASQKTTFDIPALKKGDLLKITAYCSKYGEAQKSVTVE